jgi:hypothetical protein
MNRRTFVQTAAIAAYSLAGHGQAMAADDSGKLILSAPLTHSDWMLHEGASAPIWGSEGVKHMLDACKACGWSRIYWRTYDAGRANFPSKVAIPGANILYDNMANPVLPADKEMALKYGVDLSKPEVRQRMQDQLAKAAAMDYSTFDSVATAVKYGHEIGLQIHAWISINEDDHGWGGQSDFTLKHPKYRWVRRNGVPYRSQISFAFPEAMEYKLAIVKELVSGYDVDGIFLDWLRTGDVRDNPQTDPTGVADHGYEEPLVTGFKAKYGADPHDLPNGDDRWVRYRAQPHTDFMRKVRKLVKSTKPRLSISVMGAQPWCYRGLKDPIDGNLRGMLLDMNTWAREGLMDEAVGGGYYLEGGTPEKAYEALKKETEGKVNVWLYAWVPRKVADFERDSALARKVGAKQILFWEADYIDGRPNKEELQAAMRAQAVMR